MCLSDKYLGVQKNWNTCSRTPLMGPHILWHSMVATHIGFFQGLGLKRSCVVAVRSRLCDPRWASTNPRQSQCLFLPFELQAHLPYLVFNFQELAACAIYWGEKVGQNVCVWANFRENQTWGRVKRKREGGGRACVSARPLVTTLFHSQGQCGDF